MTFGQSIQTCFSKYADFKGRASRSEYWWWQLFNYIVSIVLVIFGMVISGTPLEPSDFYSGTNFTRFLPLYVWAVAILLPSLAVTFRRLHDTGRSGWWILISLVPYVGSIVIFIFTLFASQPFENKYGPVPAGVYPQH